MYHNSRGWNLLRLVIYREMLQIYFVDLSTFYAYISERDYETAFKF